MRFISMAFIKRRLPHRENYGHNFCLEVAWAFPLIFCFYPVPVLLFSSCIRNAVPIKVPQGVCQNYVEYRRYDVFNTKRTSIIIRPPNSH